GAAALLSLRFGVAAAAGPGALAFVHFAVELVHRFVVPYDLPFGERQAGPWIAAAGLGMMIGARILDGKYRGRIDAAFWMHTTGLLALGFALTSRIFDEASEALVWSVASLAVIAAGVRWNRRVYLLCGSTAWLFWPAMLFMSHHDSPGGVIAAFVFSSVTLAGIATYLRSHWSRLAPAQNELRTVWL
ncbi:MAG: hypothetical protein WCJ30_16080, partial [Deltaproteobacteria bacterium]